MKVSETIKLLKWADEKNFGEMERIRKECELLHEQVAELSHEIASLKESLEKASSTETDNAGTNTIYDIDLDEDDVVF